MRPVGRAALDGAERLGAVLDEGLQRAGRAAWHGATRAGHQLADEIASQGVAFGERRRDRQAERARARDARQAEKRAKADEKQARAEAKRQAKAEAKAAGAAQTPEALAQAEEERLAELQRQRNADYERDPRYRYWQGLPLSDAERRAVEAEIAREHRLEQAARQGHADPARRPSTTARPTQAPRQQARQFTPADLLRAAREAADPAPKKRPRPARPRKREGPEIGD